ncbi:ATP-dependent metalloprotease FtsH [Flexistipes sinusarabici DSM 4947]|uniref:ATP-dependent zinc metalloprotease FtsH n=1 Tax=Flexistipes sinusarabici (strain ATCC 49648 / DSM 4947 / MAS 10) TaxID=717231 RepID=F8E5D2_FLESM|nr:ATP-dependent zinc metalloprotease FtsH [Flexistipes sinusarabici]AEI14628.1 ATP-dependent metalloprotease FtsH [Flexistipes sinusarabici DSM 4947]
MKNNFFKNITLWFVIALLMVIMFNFFNTGQGVREKISYTAFLEKVQKGNIKTVVIKEQHVTGEYADGTQFETYAPKDSGMVSILRENNVQIFAKPPDQNPWYVQVLISWLPFILLIGIWIFFMRQMQGGSGKAFNFGKSKAKLLTKDQQKVTFKDVAGADEAKEELEEIIEFLKEPQKFQKLGGRIPKGVLLVGPPGTGKTLLAKAVAGEAGVPYFSISGSDFVEMFVGVGASRVRDLFEQGKKNAPCIIFVDELDAVGRHRGAGLGGGHDEREQTLNQLLVEMDGFESTEGVILIAATNRPDVLDPALLRPGRFDRQVVVPPPDRKGRLEILKVHAKKIPLSDDVDLDVVAKGTPGFAGAELANLVNEASLLAARQNRDKVTMDDFEEAKDKVMMGKERRSIVISDEEKKNTAYHEAGHAIVAILTPGADPLHKVSIIPRGMALGVTQQLPEDDRYMHTKEYLLGRLAVLMGGRAAEELVFNRLTTGAGNDISRATDIARKMVCSWGMSSKIGPLFFGKKDDAVFLGKEISSSKDYSEKTAIMIDEEIKTIVSNSYKKATNILKENFNLLEQTAQLLLEKETIENKDIQDLIKKLDEGEEENKEAENENEEKKEDSKKGGNVEDESVPPTDQ